MSKLFNIIHKDYFPGEKKYNEAFRGVFFSRIREKTSSQISSS